MINIRPVSDFKNRYQEIEQRVLKDNENIYLTKNGYGAMVLMSLDRYQKIVEELKKGKESSNVISSNSTNQIDRNYSTEESFPKIKKRIET